MPVPFLQELLTKTQVTGTDGQVFLYSIAEKGVLALIANSDANVGLINLEARDAANNIAIDTLKLVKRMGF